MHTTPAKRKRIRAKAGEMIHRPSCAAECRKSTIFEKNGAGIFAHFLPKSAKMRSFKE